MVVAPDEMPAVSIVGGYAVLEVPGRR